MTDGLRRAGHGADASGAHVVWSISEGQRGRRWRESRTRGDTLLSALLLETDPEGRFLHTELATPEGLLTLHPEGNGTIHGNAVSGVGVQHVMGMPWQPDGLLLVDGSVVAAVVAAHLLAARVGVGESVVRPGLRVDLALGVQPAEIRIQRTGERAWRFDDGPALRVSEAGLPLLDGGVDWPLEAE